MPRTKIDAIQNLLSEGTLGIIDLVIWLLLLFTTIRTLNPKALKAIPT